MWFGRVSWIRWIWKRVINEQGFSGGSAVKNSSAVLQMRVWSWVRKIPWRKWQTTPVFLLGKSYGQRSMAGYIQSTGSQESDTAERLHHYHHQYRKYYIKNCWSLVWQIPHGAAKPVCHNYWSLSTVEPVLLNSSVQFSCSVMFHSVTPWTAAHQNSLSITNSQSLLRLMSIESVMPSNHLILCCSLLLLPSIFPSIRVFSSESVLRIRWPKYWSFSFSISPSNEYSRLISFRLDWLDLLAVQGTLKSLLQHHSSKTSILWLSAFFIVQLSHQLSHPNMTTGKTIPLTRWTIVNKIMPLLFNRLV